MDFLDFNRTKLELLTTELDVGHTFASIALETRDSSTRERNRSNARKAYDIASGYAQDVAVTRAEGREIQLSLRRLKSELQQLGETDLA